MIGVCRPKHVQQLRNTGIINSTTRLYLVGSFYEIYITIHGSMTHRVYCVEVKRTKKTPPEPHIRIKFLSKKYLLRRGVSV